LGTVLPTGVSGHRGFRSASQLGGYGTLVDVASILRCRDTYRVREARKTATMAELRCVIDLSSPVDAAILGSIMSSIRCKGR
jgi:hypothetical protein